MTQPDLIVREQYVATADGWSLRLRRTLSPKHFDERTEPLLIIPGYGMNSFIFSYHPRGTSMERCLAEGGYEVWALDLRGQGQSRPERSRAGKASLRNYAAIDLPAGIERVLSSTKTRARQVVLIGCSLGGTLVYGYLALHRNHRVSRLITMGAPLRWVEIHPALRLAFGSPMLVGAVRLSRTRTLVRGALPLLLRVPKLLSLYMNTATIDLRHISELTETVEDPDPAINRDIAVWVGNRDLEIEGVNVTKAMANVELPLLVVLSNRDGIVPEQTALSVVDQWGGRDVEVLKVGDEQDWYAHANLFVADDAPARVFDPILRWLRRQAPVAQATA
ncbi:MAG: alpha/beta fold hydrolase [Deltaproteobacteria bacterium]|nr:alpha/beta fold hydrolase [Deltaproteobacteria bacterium]